MGVFCCVKKLPFAISLTWGGLALWNSCQLFIPCTLKTYLGLVCPSPIQIELEPCEILGVPQFPLLSTPQKWQSTQNCWFRGSTSKLDFSKSVYEPIVAEQRHLGRVEIWILLTSLSTILGIVTWHIQQKSSETLSQTSKSSTGPSKWSCNMKTLRMWGLWCLLHIN